MQVSSVTDQANLLSVVLNLTSDVVISLVFRHGVQPMSVSQMARSYVTTNMNFGYVRQNSKNFYVSQAQVMWSWAIS